MKDLPYTNVKLSLLIASHLSDVQMGMLEDKDVHNKLNFVKWLIAWPCKGQNLNAEIDADKHWEDFTKTRFYKK